MGHGIRDVSQVLVGPFQLRRAFFDTRFEQIVHYSNFSLNLFSLGNIDITGAQQAVSGRRQDDQAFLTRDGNPIGI